MLAAICWLEYGEAMQGCTYTSSRRGPLWEPTAPCLLGLRPEAGQVHSAWISAVVQGSAGELAAVQPCPQEMAFPPHSLAAPEPAPWHQAAAAIHS